MFVWNSNFQKYRDFAVEQKSVIALWQVRKLNHDMAKKEVIGARGHTASYLKEIENIENLENKIEIEKEKKLLDAMLAKHKKPFMFVPEISLWKIQYDQMSPMGLWGETFRFMFLVLTGPSCMGKTQFAKSLFGIEHTLVVPCQPHCMSA